MNWRLRELDDFCLMSNSDAHSPWIWRIGREFNAFELKKPTYWEILNTIKKKDSKKFIFTGEVSPEYGKYHYTGHRKCQVSLHPKNAIKFNNKCPKCGKKLTVGVLQRVEELSDMPKGYQPNKSIPFKTLLPLYEEYRHNRRKQGGCPRRNILEEFRVRSNNQRNNRLQ